MTCAGCFAFACVYGRFPAFITAPAQGEESKNISSMLRHLRLLRRCVCVGVGVCPCGCVGVRVFCTHVLTASMGAAGRVMLGAVWQHSRHNSELWAQAFALS